MSVGADALRKLAALGLAPEQMAGVLDILADMQGAEEERKRAQRERTRRHRQSRDGNVTVTGQERDGDVTPHPPLDKRKEPKENYSPPAPVVSSRAREGADLDTEFLEDFWPRYPHKVGKPDAQLKFRAARRKASLAEILEGVDRYVETKPLDRPWCNPATWLNQTRWLDEPAPAPALRVVNGQGGHGNRSPPPKPKSVGQRMGDRMLNRSAPPEPENDWRTIDGLATRN